MPDKTKDTVASTFVDALSKSILQFAQTSEERQLAHRENLLKAMQMLHQQKQLDAQQREQASQMAERQARMGLIDTQIQKLNRDMLLTPEDRAKQEQADKLALEAKKHEYAMAEIAARGDASGRDDTQMRQLFQSLSGQNTGIAKYNAGLMNKYQGDVAKTEKENAENAALMQGVPDWRPQPIPSPPDTVPHIPIGDIMQSFGDFMGTGVPSFKKPMTSAEVYQIARQRISDFDQLDETKQNHIITDIIAGRLK